MKMTFLTTEQNQDDFSTEIDQSGNSQVLVDEFDKEEPFDNDDTQLIHTKIKLPARSLIEEDLRELRDDDVTPVSNEGDDEDELPELTPFQPIDEPVSSDDESINELAPMRTRRNRKKTVRFSPDFFSKIKK